jgi:N-acetylmuramoyl-L-alanine amidase
MTLNLKGKVSYFGGPDDSGVSPSEGLAFIYDVDDAPHLFLSYQPEGTTGLARRLNPETFYLATRWDYDQYPKDYLLTEMALVRNLKTGKQVKVYPSDWGPHETTGRVADVSPAVMEYLGLKTDDEVEVIFPFTHRAPAVVAKPYPRIRMSSGHSTLCQGAVGILNEVAEATRVTDRVAQLLIERGVDCATFHDTTSKDQNTNLHKITDWTNSKPHDLAVSCHFNANVETSSPMGVECLWVTQEALAKKISDAIAKVGFKNRGPKYRNDLWFLNQTEMPSILMEICFVDSSADAALYRETFEEICQSIATVLGGEAKAKPEPKVA